MDFQRSGALITEKRFRCGRGLLVFAIQSEMTVTLQPIRNSETFQIKASRINISQLFMSVIF